MDGLGDPDIPGPGFYGDPNPEGLGRSGPAFTFRPRTADKRPEDVPGPGQHTQALSKAL